MKITPQQVKQMLDNNEDFIILDVRGKCEYEGGHLPGAINLPLAELPFKANKMLPDKDKIIVVYCLSGGRSKRAAMGLEKLGFTKVLNMGGISGWTYEIV